MEASKIEEKVGYTHINFDLNQVGDAHEEFIEWMEDQCINSVFCVVFHLTHDDNEVTVVVHDGFGWQMFKDGWDLRNLL